MRRIIIVGAGGFGRELYFWMKQSVRDDGNIAGFLSNSAADLAAYPHLPPYLGTVDDYELQGQDEFVIAIGDIEARKRLTATLKKKKAKFYTFIHPTSVITETAKLGEGCIIGPLCVVSNEAVVGDQVVLNTQCVIGHDSKIGAYSVLSPMAGIMGGVELSDEVFMGANALVAPRLKVGRGAKISAGVSIFRDVAEYTLMLGALPKAMPFRAPDQGKS